MKKNIPAVAVLAVLVISLSITTTAGAQQQQEPYTEAHVLVDSSYGTLRQFIADPNMEAFRDLARTAQGILIIPQLLRGGLVVGGTGGSGVLFARNSENNTWNGPAFYTIGSVTFGFQVGAEASQVVMVIMTKKGLNSMLSSSFKLGAEVSMAAGPIGGGTKAATADILAYAKSKGAFGGFTVEGAVISTKNGWNDSYYAQPTLPDKILLSGEVTNPHADTLRNLITEIGAPATQKVKY